MPRRPTNMPVPATLPLLAVLAAIVLAAFASRPSTPAATLAARPVATAERPEAAPCDIERMLAFVHARIEPSPVSRAASASARIATRAVGAPHRLVTLVGRHATRRARLALVDLHIAHAALAYAAHNLISAVRFPPAPIATGRDTTLAGALEQLRACIVGDPSGDAIPDGILDAGDLCAILARLEAQPLTATALAMR